jgi:DNA invertase Pin-like site-specific DNA recombinase
VVDQLASRGIGFRSITEGLHTEGPMGTVIRHCLTRLAQVVSQPRCK